MPNDLTSLGVGGIFALMILKTVFDFIGKRKNGHVDFVRMSSQVKDLYDVTIVRKSLEIAIRELAENVSEQTRMLRAIRDDDHRAERTT